MIRLRRCAALMCVAIALSAAPSAAQNPPPAPDTRGQFPWLLENGYLGVSLGMIDTAFTASQLQPGFRAGTIAAPRAGFQIALFGKQFNRYFAAEMNYTRPVRWASFEHINRTDESHSAWVVLGEFKLRARLPITPHIALYGDAGVGVTSRHGAETDAGATLVTSEHYPALLLGGGVEYSVNERWRLVAGLTHAAASRTHNQPRTIIVSAGVRYHLRPLDAARVAEASRGDYAFPKHLVQVGYAYGGAGFGLNRFFSSTVPIFWNGSLSVDHGFTVRYEQNIFHTPKRLAVDLGSSVSRWHAPKSPEHLASGSVYAMLRYFLVRSASADVQVYYSIAGPTLLSTTTMNHADIGTNHFTFQDLLGVGILAGQSKRMFVGIGLGHYSNGNLFPINAGVAIPLTMSIGYAY
jgi:hypothetical protein